MHSSMLKKVCLMFGLLVASPVVHASPWVSFAALGSYYKSLFARPSNSQVQPNNGCSQVVHASEVPKHNLIKYIFGCSVGLGTVVVGYYQYCKYRSWQEYVKAGKTNNIVQAIILANEAGIHYWLPKINESNVNSPFYILGDCGSYTSPFAAAVRAKRPDLVTHLFKYKPNLNATIESQCSITGSDLQDNFKKDPTLLDVLLTLGLDPNQHYDNLDCILHEPHYSYKKQEIYHPKPNQDDQPYNSLRGKERRNVSHVPLSVAFEMAKNKKAMLALVRHGATLNPDQEYIIRKFSGNSLEDTTPLLHQQASSLVNKTRVTTLASIKVSNQAVFPKGIREKIESFL